MIPHPTPFLGLSAEPSDLKRARVAVVDRVEAAVAADE